MPQIYYDIHIYIYTVYLFHHFDAWDALLRHCYAAEVPLIARATAAAAALYSQPLKTESMRCTWENSGKIPGYAWRFENGDSMGTNKGYQASTVVMIWGYTLR